MRAFNILHTQPNMWGLMQPHTHTHTPLLCPWNVYNHHWKCTRLLGTASDQLMVTKHPAINLVCENVRVSYVCVCMCVCVNVCVYSIWPTNGTKRPARNLMREPSCMCIMCVYMCVCVRISDNVCVYIASDNVCVYIASDQRMGTKHLSSGSMWMRVCVLLVCVCVCVCACMYVCIYVYAYVLEYIICMYVYIYIHILNLYQDYLA